MKTKEIVYLKQITEWGNPVFRAFDKNNLTEVRISNNSMEYEKHDLRKDFDWSMGYDLQDGFTECTREEFNAECLKVTKEYNEIIKKL